jgi:hypothetical protein
MKPTEIGIVDSVIGNLISIRMQDAYPSNMPVIDGVVYRIGQIGSFVKIPLGYAQLYGIVTEVGTTAIPEAIFELAKTEPSLIQGKRWLKAVLVGEQVGNRFERGVMQSPTAGDVVHLVSVDDLKIIYGVDHDKNDTSSIIIGNISASESLDAWVDLNKLVSRHCALLGSTGSGKSNAVTVLLRSIAQQNMPSARILIIDPHGEYGEVLANMAKVFKIGATGSEVELEIPYWVLPFDELISIFPGNLNDIQKDYIREKIYNMKLANIHNYSDIRGQSISIDSPIPFSIKQLWFELDDFERLTFEINRTTPTKLVKTGDAEKLQPNEYPPCGIGSSAPFANNARKGILSFLDGMRSRILDPRFSFLFNGANYSPSIAGAVATDIDQLFKNWFCHDKIASIIDLSGVPSQIMQTISGVLLKTVYDALFWAQKTSVGGKSQPLLIVLEEAHNYLKSGEESFSSRILQTIAKEGRKYGVGLLLVTQRPSELDETVLSQCGTMIALRMNNTKDQSHISGSMQDDLQTMADVLSSLRTGEAIITGEAVKIPSRIKIFRAPYSPKSSDPIASEQWAQPKPDGSDYTVVVRNWRNQSFN